MRKKGKKEDKKEKKDEGEDILVRCYNTDKVKTMLNDGKIINGATLIALQWFYLNYKII